MLLHIINLIKKRWLSHIFTYSILRVIVVIGWRVGTVGRLRAIGGATGDLKRYFRFLMFQIELFWLSKYLKGILTFSEVYFVKEIKNGHFQKFQNFVKKLFIFKKVN